ncbi:MAG TPA: DNA-directed RNA polymerase subunit alpha [Candidatus Sulfotelmatobacter sp.]|jgi:DNA-directed RNA polymerase subunit alpha|nr:DNA-directed RNA polymerase subunit alpha [Candidatus Sulfotelmatobacter sp.]
MEDITFKVKEITLAPDFGEFVIEPLEPGYGHTIGNALRRVLYTSIQGAAITSVRITGVKHKFSTFPGLKENIVDLLLNIKELNLRLSDSKESATVKLSVKGAKRVTAGDLELSDGVEVVDKEQYIGSLSGDKAKLEMELTVEKGYGFSLAEERHGSTLGVMTTDAVFTPVRRVTYEVTATRVGRRTDLDKLTLKIWTNGTVNPKDALVHASKLLSSYFMQVYAPKEVSVQSDAPAATSSVPQNLLNMTIDELDLPTRIYNSLRNGGIETIEQLLATPRKELVSMRNMGGKSISVIEEKLGEKGISLNI